MEAGEAPQWIARMLGHKTVEILFERYAKWMPNRTRQDGRALEAHLRAQHAPEKRPIVG